MVIIRTSGKEMAPRELQLPGTWPTATKGGPVDEKRFSLCARYVLYRAGPDGMEKPVSEHSDFGSGMRGGTRAVTVEDAEGAYSLYDRRRRVARFGYIRLLRRVEGLG